MTAPYPPILPVQICDANGNYIGPGGGGGTGGAGTGLLDASPPVNSGGVEGSHVMKTGAGSLVSISVVIGAVNGWLMLFDRATTPANGAVVPVFVVPVYSDGTMGFYEKVWTSPLQFGAGMVAVFSSTGPLTLTISPTALFSGQVL